MLLGLAVVTIGLSELLEDVLITVLPGLDMHHALILLGAVTSLRGVIDVVEGAGKIVEGEERR